MKTFASALTGSFLMATALTPAVAADLTHERALNVAKEPQNWLLHHGNYEGHRFSALKEINTDNAEHENGVQRRARGSEGAGLATGSAT
jgi:alcohol dehydrogenase (cytochrome c)